MSHGCRQATRELAAVYVGALTGNTDNIPACYKWIILTETLLACLECILRKREADIFSKCSEKRVQSVENVLLCYTFN